MIHINHTVRILTFLFSLTMSLFCSANGSITHSGSGFIKVSSLNPRYFEYSDGKRWIPIEINFPIFNRVWENDSLVFRRIDKLLANFSKNGGNSIRLWGPGEFLEVEDEIMGVGNPIKFQRLDRFIQLAKKYNIRIKFCLEIARNFNAYHITDKNHRFYRKIYGTESGGPLKRFSEYLNSTTGRQIYLQRALLYINQYKSDTTIYCWELWNEINAVDEGDWYRFTADIIPYIKTVAPNQLVTQSLGSLDSDRNASEYTKYLKIKSLDILEVHRYLDEGAPLPQCRGPIDASLWDAVHFVTKNSTLNVRPIFVNEVGAVQPRHTGDSELYKLDTAGLMMQDMLFAPFFSGAAGPGSMWHYWSYVEKNNLWYQYGNFSEVLKIISPLPKKTQPSSSLINGVRFYSLVGTKKTVIWCRDQKVSSIAELKSGEPSAVRSKVKIYWDRLLPGKRIKRIRTIDPSRPRLSSDYGDNDSTFIIPDFRRSIILVIDHE